MTDDWTVATCVLCGSTDVDPLPGKDAIEPFRCCKCGGPATWLPDTRTPEQRLQELFSDFD